VLIGSVGLTALLLGGAAGGLIVWRTFDERLQDAEFLKQQLQAVNPEGDRPAATRPALVRVDTARRKAVHPQRTIIGRLVEVHQVTVASEVEGKLVEMPVEEGTGVAGGQTLLARIDDTWCRLARDRSKAQMDATDAKLRFERAELGRFKDLIGRSAGAVSQSDIESKQATVDELVATLYEAETALKEQTERIARSEIKAPFDGIVIAKHAELGGHVSLGDPIVEIVSRGEIDALLMVPELAINLIHLGEDLSIRIDPLGEEVSGRVVSVTAYGPTASRTFPVRVRLDDRGGVLKVGMSVTAMIPTGPEREALVVSRDAVLMRPDGSTVWVALPEPGGQTAQVQPVPVTVTARMQGEYAVEPETDKGRELLGAGSTVVIEGAERLMPGQQVSVVTLEVALADRREG
jgi:RND family efflux transporter MFP subunit